jgi:hypothetical protein
MTMTLIEHKELGSAAASIEFANIPQTYTDLMLVASARATSNNGGAVWAHFDIQPNGLTTNRSERFLYGDGSSAASTSSSFIRFWGNSSNSTANTFGNAIVYIPNYTSSNNKSFSIDGVSENNATTAIQAVHASLWSSTSAITSLKIETNSAGNIAQYSSFTLYGILKGSDGTTTVS